MFNKNLFLEENGKDSSFEIHNEKKEAINLDNERNPKKKMKINKNRKISEDQQDSEFQINKEKKKRKIKFI